ncbi:MAG: AMP-binding protein [Gammaproteobacteria bacterium]|nr:AMP-binding protein [Gammaproteobacteria bacterium]
MSESSLARRFDEIVRRHAGRVAVEAATGPVTYAELDATANRIARAVLDHRGEGPEPVAVLMGRELPDIAAIVALAKAGKAWVPLDPEQPPRRLAELLSQCRPGLLLAVRRHAALARMVAGTNCDVLDLDALDGGDEEVQGTAGSDTPAYIIYTSGSTGRPKGVVHSHAGLLHQVMRHTHALTLGPEDRITMLGSPGAAQANTQLWATLLNGATLYPRDLRQEGLGDLAGWLAHHRITCFRSSATLFRHWATHLPAGACPDLRLVAIGGETVYRADVELHRARFPRGCRLVNALSSTETGTVCMHVLQHDTPVQGHVVPVGRPLADVALRLLDAAGAEVPAGTTGEIEVGSRGIALGYWTRDGLDAREFPADARDPAVRRHRLGDFGRWLADGLLLHLGRMDSVVKIAGHRVDASEVERALCEAEGVAQAAVIGRDDSLGDTQLVGCIVPAIDPPPARATLRGFLQQRLPAHMIPAHFEFVARLPLTASGKPDREALHGLAAAWTAQGARGGRLGMLGVQFGVIWEDLLGITGIGPDDDFVDLGGNSLLAMEMLLRVERACGRRLRPSQLLGGPLTIGRMVEQLMADGQADLGEPLVPVQTGNTRRPLFFLHGDHENGGLYCHALARQLGSDQPFYAVTPHGLDGDALPWRIEDMARDRLTAIRAVQPRGPYQLGGFCTGGMVAVEMTRQLEAQGERVDILLLVDAAFDNAPLVNRLASRAMRVLARALRWDEPTRRRRFLRLREALGHYRASGQAGPWGRTRWVITKLKGLAGRLTAAPPPADSAPAPTPGASAFDAHIARHESYRARRHDYLAGRVRAPIAIFRSDYLQAQPPGAGWTGLAPRVAEQSIAASHQDTLTRHVDVLAAWMKPWLAPPGP